jgi:hypothetical protein
MKVKQPIPVLLVVFLLLLNLVIATAVEQRELAWPQTLAVCGLAIVFTQVALVGAWLVWGRANIVIRLMAALGVIYLLASTASVCTQARASEWFTVLMFDAAFTVLGFALARILKVSISTETEPTAEKGSDTVAWQFSIWGVLSVMTGVACTLAASRLGAWSGTVFQAALSFVAVAMLSCLAFLITFWPFRRWIIATVVVTASAATGWFLVLTDLRAGDERQGLLLVAVCVIHGVTLAGAAELLQIGGYRRGE